MHRAKRKCAHWRGIYWCQSQQAGSGEENVCIRLTIAWLFFPWLVLFAVPLPRQMHLHVILSDSAADVAIPSCP